MSYESDSLRSIYLLFHYGSKPEILDGLGFDPGGIPEDAFHFPCATTEMSKSVGNDARVLDIGCAVGRSSFEFSKSAESVIGIDFSQSFIDVAEAIRKEEAVSYSRFSEAHLGDFLEVALPENSNPERVSFEQGDAMNLRPDLGSFDIVHAANLLCRLPRPADFLHRLPNLVKPGGQLIMATPCTWLEEFTPRENQPGGKTIDFIIEHIGNEFELIEVRELPFLIREHVRKFQMSTSQTSLWRRIG